MDDVFEALADDKRRKLLVALMDEGRHPEAALSLPDDVVWGRAQQEVIRSQLYHEHLPRLEAAGFVDWDQENWEVTRGPNFEEIRPMLELLTGSDLGRSETLA